MSVKAETYKTNPGKITAAKRESKLILGRIYDEIKQAYDEEQSEVYSTIPITFGIPCMKNSSAQRMVYYFVLTDLLDNDYIVEILLSEDKTIFHIKWITEDEEKEIMEQNALLAKHTVKIAKGKKV